MVFQQIKMTKDTYYLKCDTLEEFQNFCREGGWNNHEEFQKATGMTFTDIQGKWFEIDDNNRINIKNENE